MFRSKCDSWPEKADVAVSEDGREKVAAMLKRQGVNVKGLVKTAPVKEEPEPYIDVTGNLQPNMQTKPQKEDSRNRIHALSIGEKFLENDFLYEKLSWETPIYIVTEGSEPPFFTRFFTWDSAKAIMHGNSFQRKLIIVKMAELQS
ncbi:villin putative [Euphorbia peplus]|nr:villin putative [Euphorbia peplus]